MDRYFSEISIVRHTRRWETFLIQIIADILAIYQIYRGYIDGLKMDLLTYLMAEIIL